MSGLKISLYGQYSRGIDTFNKSTLNGTNPFIINEQSSLQSDFAPIWRYEFLRHWECSVWK